MDDGSMSTYSTALMKEKKSLHVYRLLSVWFVSSACLSTPTQILLGCSIPRSTNQTTNRPIYPPPARQLRRPVSSHHTFKASRRLAGRSQPLHSAVTYVDE